MKFPKMTNDSYSPPYDNTTRIIERLAERACGMPIEQIRATPLCELRAQAEARIGRPLDIDARMYKIINLDTGVGIVRVLTP